MSRVSIITVAYNSALYIQKCLNSLRDQTFNDFEIIFINNGLQDGSMEIVQDYRNVFDIKIIEQPQNIGFAAANNIGANLAQGEWIILLNADAYPEPNWLEQLIKAAEDYPKYNFFSSRQVQYNMPHLLDGAGDEYHVSGLAWRRYYNYFEKEHGLEQEEVFGACAAAAMYRREDFLKMGGFDEDYFSYFEDVDLSFRLRLAGGHCLYVPQALVHHVGSASTGKLSDFVVYHGHRNLVWTYFKDMPNILLWLYMPLHLAMNLFFIVSFIFQGKGRAILRAKWDALRGIPAVLRKRKNVQSMQTVSNREIYRFMSENILAPYWAARKRSLQQRG